MSDWISYQGKGLGRIKSDDRTLKPIFVSESLDSLATLLSLSPEDIVETESRGQITYEVLKMDYLANISAFYPTIEQWVLKNERARTIEEAEKEHPKS